jgi:hypothetical protein
MSYVDSSHRMTLFGMDETKWRPGWIWYGVAGPGQSAVNTKIFGKVGVFKDLRECRLAEQRVRTDVSRRSCTKELADGGGFGSAVSKVSAQ